jgi:hypothetical protein
MSKLAKLAAGSRCQRIGCAKKANAPMMLGGPKGTQRIDLCAQHFQDAAQRIDAHSAVAQQLFAAILEGR